MADLEEALALDPVSFRREHDAEFDDSLTAVFDAELIRAACRPAIRSSRRGWTGPTWSPSTGQRSAITSPSASPARVGRREPRPSHHRPVELVVRGDYADPSSYRAAELLSAAELLGVTSSAIRNRRRTAAMGALAPGRS